MKPPAEFKVMRVRDCATPADIVDTPDRVFTYWQVNIATAPWFDPAKEAFVVLILNTRRRILGHNLVALGGLDNVAVHPREVFRPVIVAAGSAIILAHNHPSGDPTPSARLSTSFPREFSCFRPRSAHTAGPSGVLEQGRLAGELTFEGSPQESARLITAALEGSILLARSFGDSSRLAASARRMRSIRPAIRCRRCRRSSPAAPPPRGRCPSLPTAA